VRLSYYVCTSNHLKIHHSSVSPVSVFDQRLDEDPSVNRLEDSIILWTSICSSKLLAKTQLILFLNKCDLLRRKLKRGIRVNQYLPSFGDRQNEIMTVVKCEFSSQTQGGTYSFFDHHQIFGRSSRIFRNKTRRNIVRCTSTLPPSL
jgi:hypothetical protein